MIRDFPIEMANCFFFNVSTYTCLSCFTAIFFLSRKWFFNQSFSSTDESTPCSKEFFHQRAAKIFSITRRISSGYQLTFQSDELLSECQTSQSRPSSKATQADTSPIPIIIFLKKSLKVPSKTVERIFWKHNFSSFFKVNLKTNFISQLYVILAFIWCWGHKGIKIWEHYFVDAQTPVS